MPQSSSLCIEAGWTIAAAQDAFAIRFPAALAVEFVCGACTGLDEYTVFLSPTQTGEPICAV